jgi:hypothetical protein
MQIWQILRLTPVKCLYASVKRGKIYLTMHTTVHILSLL